jgi:hypothetical protein
MLTGAPMRHLSSLSPRDLMRARPRLWMHLLPSAVRPWLFGGD